MYNSFIELQGYTLAILVLLRKKRMNLNSYHREVYEIFYYF